MEQRQATIGGQVGRAENSQQFENIGYIEEAIEHKDAALGSLGGSDQDGLHVYSKRDSTSTNNSTGSLNLSDYSSNILLEPGSLDKAIAEELGRDSLLHESIYDNEYAAALAEESRLSSSYQESSLEVLPPQPHEQKQRSEEEFQEVLPCLQFTNKFHSKYWRNDRKNIQCFPFCTRYDDYYNVRMHELWKEHKRICGTNVIVKVMGIPQAARDKPSEFVAIGRIALLGDGGNVGLFSAGQQVPLETVTAASKANIPGSITQGKESLLVVFSQPVWKVDMTLSKKRRAAKSPTNTPRYAFEVVLFLTLQETNNYTVLLQGLSAPFEIASTRTLNREMKVLKGEASVVNGTSNASQTRTKRKLEQKDGPGDIPLHKDVIRMKPNQHIRPPSPGGEEEVRNAKPTFNEEHHALENKPVIDSALPPKALQDEGQAESERLGGHGASVQTLDDIPTAIPATTNQEQVVQSQAGESQISEEFVFQYSLATMYVVCLFGGLFGAHRFLLQDMFWGRFYACSLGGLGLGFIVDLIRLPTLYKARVEKLRRLHTDPDYKEPELLELPQAYILLFASGLFGGHHFYMGNKEKGFLYLFTLGLFGFGWITDFCYLESMVKKHNTEQVDRFRLQHGERHANDIELPRTRG